MQCIPRATRPPRPLTTASVSLWTVLLLQVSRSPPGSPTQPCGPVVSNIGNQRLKEKPILHCGQECAFTHTSMFHPVTSTQACSKHMIFIPPPHCGERSVFLVSHVKETANYQTEIIGAWRPQQS